MRAAKPRRRCDRPTHLILTRCLESRHPPLETSQSYNPSSQSLPRTCLQSRLAAREANTCRSRRPQSQPSSRAAKSAPAAEGESSTLALQTHSDVVLPRRASEAQWAILVCCSCVLPVSYLSDNKRGDIQIRATHYESIRSRLTHQFILRSF